MSKNLSSVAVTQFDTEVKHAYQSMGVLAGTTTERRGVVGDTYKFRKMGKGLAKERTAPSADAVPMNVDHSFATATLTNWDAPEYTDIFDKQDVNFDEVRELGETVAGALGRRDDQLKIDAMVAGTYNATPVQGTSGGLVGTDVGGVGSNLNVAKLRRIKKYLDDNEAGDDRHILVSSSGIEALLGETQTTSTDYNTSRVLVNGKLDQFLGFKFHMIGIRVEGGLPKAGAVRDGFAWDAKAIGYANGLDVKTRVGWSEDKDSWKSTGYLKAGAVIRDIDGIVKYQATEA
jgi:hypothetical protein